MDSAGHSYTDLRYGYLKPWVAVVGNPAEDSLCKRFWAGGLSSWLLIGVKDIHRAVVIGRKSANEMVGVE